jgi:hypothetical protein
VERARQLLSTDEGGGARALGGLVLASGLLVLLIRRTEFADPWGDGLVFWILFLTAGFLFGTGFLGARLSPTTYSWQRAFVVFGLVLIPAAGFAFVQWIGGNTDAPLNSAWIFLLTALAAFAAALIGGVRVGCLLGGIALIVTWLAVWHELLDEGIGGDLGTLRGLLIVIALILLLIAGVVAVRGRPEGGGSDLVTAAGIAAVWGAGLLTVTSGIGPVFTPLAVDTDPLADTSLFWDLLLLLTALGLIAYGAVSGIRGPAYVGTVGLALFIFIVGSDLDDSSPAGKVLGWPLVLLLLGGALLAWSLLPALRRKPG